MISQVLLLFVGIFAVIGLITSMYTVIECCRSGKKSSVPVDVVLYVRDCEDEIEGLVRHLSAYMTSGTDSINYQRLIAIDCGSNDSTAVILKALEKDIDILSLVSGQEYSDRINNFFDHSN